MSGNSLQIKKKKKISVWAAAWHEAGLFLAGHHAAASPPNLEACISSGKWNKKH